jgi:hypothetical protein
MIADKWEDYGDDWLYHLVAVTAGKFKERYIFTIGGLNYTLFIMNDSSNFKKMAYLDTWDPNP